MHISKTTNAYSTGFNLAQGLSQPNNVEQRNVLENDTVTLTSSVSESSYSNVGIKSHIGTSMPPE